ncbi:GH3 auxin-responsive promoter family protein [Candidatus Poriferisodalis sp.]|uniref:GH3 auxin-responsive promoter family protein n=1 Tax=Candidatus Poriferisodalis sp. TaxID=3101277 RepID=UPI003AF69E82
MTDGFNYRLLRAGLAAASGRTHRRLVDACAHPRAAQDQVLQRILSDNAGTVFGADHRFGSVAGFEDYQRAVPVQTYEDLREGIERQEATGEPCLTAEQPVYYNQTSGTVAAPKNIPLTKAGLARIQRLQRLAAYALSRRTSALGGKVFVVSGAAHEGTMPAGTPYGSASGQIYASQGALLRRRYVLPASVSDIADYDARYLTMAVLGAADDSVTAMATANPSTFVRLMDVLNTHAEMVLTAVATGKLPAGCSVENRSDQLGLRADPERAAALGRCLETAGELTYADIWSDLRAVVTWTGGSCGLAVERLQPMLTSGCPVFELGYLASEVSGTVNIDPIEGSCVATLADNFFEFAERDAWEAAADEADRGLQTCTLADLETGRDYYVIVTTADGLYRYDMNDIVRVTGWVDRTPVLSFIQKGKGVTSITGEKLYESQAISAVTAAIAELGTVAPFFIMLADEAEATYTLYAELTSTRDAVPEPSVAGDLASSIERSLRHANVEYDAKRASGRLAPLRVRFLAAGTGDAYRRQRVADGQRDVQFKYLHLQYSAECSFGFDDFLTAT